MTAGTEVVCSDVVRKVESEDKCIAGLDTRDLNEVGDAGTVHDNVGGNGNSNVGGNGKDDNDDSSYVFVSGSSEVASADPADKVDVNVDAISPKSDWSDEVDQFQKEKLGIENGGIPVDSLVLETNGIANGSATVGDPDVKADKDEVNLENGSTVDPPVLLESNGIAHDVNGHPDKNTGEEEQVVESTEVNDADEITNVEAKMDDIVSEITVDPGSTLNPIETSQVTVIIKEPESQVTITQSVSTPDPVNTTDESLCTANPVRNTDGEVMVNGGQESVSNVIDKAECQVTVNGSSKQSEDLECQITDDLSESSKSPPRELEVNEPGKPAEDLEFQATVDESESSKSPPQELESQITVNEPGKPTEDLELQATVDESESSKSLPPELESQVTVDKPGKPTEDLELQATINESESSKSPPPELESQVTVDEPGKSTEDLERQATIDESESSKRPPEELEDQVTVDESCKPTEDSKLQATADESESSKSQPQELEDKVKADGPGKPFEDLELQATVDESESSKSPSQELEIQVTVDEPGTPYKHLECEVIADDPESSESPPQELEDQVTVNESGKPFEDLECQVIAEEPKSASPINEQECQVPVNGSDSIDSSIGNQESPVPESNGNHTEKVDTYQKSEEHQDLSIVDSEVKVEAEPNHICNGTEADHQTESKKPEESVTESDTEPKENQDSGLVLSEVADTLPNGQVEKSNGILEMEETQIVADEDVPLTHDTEKTESEEKQVEESSEPPVKVTEEPVELETNIQEMKDHVKLEDEIQESQVQVTDNVENDMNNTAESTIEAEAPLETEPITHDDTVSENEVSRCLDESFQPQEQTENVTDCVESQCKNSDNDLVSNPDELTAEETKLDNGVSPHDEEQETKVEETPVESKTPEAYINPAPVIEFGSLGRHETVPNFISVPDVINRGTTKPDTDMDGIQSDEIPVTDAPNAHKEEEESSEVLPYNFLIRIPRFEDDMFKEQIRNAQLQVEEKTRLRDLIRVDIQTKRARLRAHNEAYNAAKQEETAAKRLVRLKRQEIDSVQSVINRLKNAESVEEIDHRIYNMEHMIQHETLCLKDEKQLIREMKQLKTIRDQLASNLGSQDEIQQAMDQKDQTEVRMKTLRKELDGLKEKVTRAEAATSAVGKKYDEISKKERELQLQFRAADDVRQQAYAHLNTLKKQSYDKNKNFRQYKDNVMAAKDFASRGDKDSLHRLCANQVEAFMEQWNNNPEFRNDYVNRCNMNATRRQKYFDGNSLPHDDVAVDRNLVSIPTESKPASVIPPVKQEMVSLKPIENPTTPQKNQTLKTKDVGKEESESATSAKEEVTKEEMELAKKEEELRKQEFEAKQKEQRRLEEKAKATEALERKKRIAEKAQLRAELRARKEAEQKEKEREKRMRKKEKKKAGGDGSVNGEDSESSNEATTKDDIIINNSISNNNNNNSVMTKKRLVKPPAHFFSKQLKPKPVPPPASIRNRKRWQHWVKLGLAAVAVLALFLLGNTGFFLNLKVQKTNGNGGGF